MKSTKNFNGTNSPPFQGGAGVVKERKNNLPKLKHLRIDLRNRLTPAEKLLWYYLKNSNFENTKFRRQHSFNSYILDFYCPKKKIAIELDGDTHFSDNGKAYDLIRDRYLESEGIKVLRFANNIIFNNMDFVLETIRQNLK